MDIDAMKFARQFAFSAALMVLVAGHAHALEFKTIGANPAVMYDAPSERGRKIFIAPRGMPVEIVLVYGDWSKVRDVAGDLNWVESKVLSPKRNVVVKVPNAKVRTSADDSASIVFSADRGLILERLDSAASSWVKVKHRDGLIGFVKAVDVWGE